MNADLPCHVKCMLGKRTMALGREQVRSHESEGGGILDIESTKVEKQKDSHQTYIDERRDAASRSYASPCCHSLMHHHNNSTPPFVELQYKIDLPKSSGTSSAQVLTDRIPLYWT